VEAILVHCINILNAPIQYPNPNRFRFPCFYHSFKLSETKTPKKSK